MSDSSTEFSSDVDLTVDADQGSSTLCWQDRPGAVEDPVWLFRQFVSAVSSDTLKDAQLQSEFLTSVRYLCVKNPFVAKYLAQEILNHSKDDIQPEVRGSKEDEPDPNSKRSSRKKSQSNFAYRPSKSTKKQTHDAKARAEDSQDTSEVRTIISGLVTRQPGDDKKTVNQSRRSHVMEEPISKCERNFSKIIAEKISDEGEEDYSAAHNPTLPPISSKSVSHPLKATNSSDSIGKNAIHPQASATLDKATEDSQIIAKALSLTEAKQPETAAPAISGKASDDQAISATSSAQKIKLQETPLPDSTPATPAQQIGRGFQSPLSDQTVTPQTVLFTPTIKGEVLSPLTENDRTSCPPDKVELAISKSLSSSPPRKGQQQASLCNTASTQTEQADREQSSQLDKVPALADMVTEATYIISQMSRHKEIPTGVHSKIFATIRLSLGGTPATTAALECSDSIWITNSSETWSASMWINMLEAGHARSKEVTIHSMLEWIGASVWFDAEIQQAEKASPLTKRGTPRKRVATVVLDKYLKEARGTTSTESPEKFASKENRNHSSTPGLAGIQEAILDTKRKRLIKIFHRGRILHRLVQLTSLGILFDPNIWIYAKGSKGNVDRVAEAFQADSQKMKLLSTFDEQIELLVQKGRPDLARFFDLLDLHSIIPSKEALSLRVEYGLEKEPIPQSCLETAINQLIEKIVHVFGKHSLSDEDSIIINGEAELPLGIFDRLRSREWLKCWDIAAALAMADVPVFMKVGRSVALHKRGRNGEVIAVSEPFYGWRKDIDKYSRESENDKVYICPVNANANHFSLLEINEQKKMIYHYDSMATHSVIQGKKKVTIVGQKVQEAFKDLGFRYTEMPTPQQRDGWSCGLMVIRNAKRRMSGLSVGTWADEVDPDRMIKEVVSDFQNFLENDALQRNPLSKKRKQSNAIEPSRSSKRLKDTNKALLGRETLM